MSKERLLIALDKSEAAENGSDFDNTRIKIIRNDFSKWRYGFSKSKIKEIRKNVYGIKKTQKSF